jgi:biopolymer transport protein ExbB/TolQ
MNGIIGKINDGGPVFTITILLLLLCITGLFIWSVMRNDYSKKSRSIIANVGWVALAWGYLGRTFGLIMAFDNIAAAGEITPQHMAGGLKMALIGPLMGIVAFVVARIFILILQAKSKKETFE